MDSFNRAFYRCIGVGPAWAHAPLGAVVVFIVLMIPEIASSDGSTKRSNGLNPVNSILDMNQANIPIVTISVNLGLP